MVSRQTMVFATRILPLSIAMATKMLDMGLDFEPGAPDVPRPDSHTMMNDKLAAQYSPLERSDNFAHLDLESQRVQSLRIR